MDLIVENGKWKGIIWFNISDGTFHRFRANQTILATGGFGRTYNWWTTAHSTTGDGNAMVSRVGFPLSDLEFI